MGVHFLGGTAMAPALLRARYIRLTYAHDEVTWLCSSGTNRWQIQSDPIARLLKLFLLGGLLDPFRSALPLFGSYFPSFNRSAPLLLPLHFMLIYPSKSCDKLSAPGKGKQEVSHQNTTRLHFHWAKRPAPTSRAVKQNRGISQVFCSPSTKIVYSTCLHPFFLFSPQRQSLITSTGKIFVTAVVVAKKQGLALFIY